MEPAIEINSISLLLLEFYDGGQLFKYEIRDEQLLKVRKDGIHQLQLRIAEMICLWESIFPDSENYFQLHQIMDLVSSIPSLFGSAHSLSDLRVSRSAMSRFATNLRIQFTEEQEADEEQEANDEQ